jgi:DNA-binding NarL/FixJ family response regulator
MLDRKLHELIEAAVTENWTTMRAHNHRMTLMLEQIIAGGMASGEFPAGDTALELKISRGTARNQLESIFAKTNTARRR